MRKLSQSALKLFMSAIMIHSVFVSSPVIAENKLPDAELSGDYNHEMEDFPTETGTKETEDTAAAEKIEQHSDSELKSNPKLYENVSDIGYVEKLNDVQENEGTDDSQDVIFETPEEAAELIKQMISIRYEDTFTYKIKMYPKEEFNIYDNDEQNMMYQVVMLHNSINNIVFAHDPENPKGGQYGSYMNNNSSYSRDWYQEDNYYIVTFVDGISYFHSQEEEEELDKKINEIISSLDLENKSDYDKIFSVYEYMTGGQITYDLGARYAHSPYGALIDNKAVCQGVSLAVYRLLLEVGVDVRCIYGNFDPYDPTPMHEWNIVKIGEYYYNIDATWDLYSTPEYWGWFLKSQATFPDHKRTDYYASETFTVQYPISPLDYGDDAVYVYEGESYEITLNNGESKALVFDTAQLGEYTLQSIGSTSPIKVEFDGMFYYGQPDYVRNCLNVNDISNKYFFRPGNCYRFYVSFKDASESGSFTLQLNKNLIEERAISSVNVQSLHYFEGTGETINSNDGEFKYYAVSPVDMSITLDNGETVQGTLEEVTDILEHTYEIETNWSIDGDTQAYTSPWEPGTYPLTLHFNEYTVEYTVEISGNQILSVTVSDPAYLYDDEYERIDNNTRIYLFSIEEISVMTSNKTYTGTYNDVYGEIIEDIGEYPYTPNAVYTTSIYSDTGIHEITVNLFGVDVTMNVEIKYNPVNYIIVHQGRIDTENDRYEKTETFINEIGEQETVKYLAYEYEPEVVFVKFKGSDSISGSLEEVSNYLLEQYEYQEPFTYENTESYNNRWGFGSHAVTIKLRNASCDYNVIVKSNDIVPLELDEVTEVIKPEHSNEVLFSFSTTLLSSIHGLTYDAEDVLITLYDSDMHEVSSSSRDTKNDGYAFITEFTPSETYYIGVRFDGDTEICHVKMQKLLDWLSLKSNTGGQMTGGSIFENEGVLKEEIINGEAVQYIWYDWNPVLEVQTSAGNFRGTFEEISEAMYQKTGIYLEYEVSYKDKYYNADYQSYNTQWTVDSPGNVILSVFNYERMYQVYINEGPIQSLKTDDIEYYLNTGELRNALDSAGNEQSYMYYNLQPVNIIAHTVDGDIQGTEDEILSQIEQTYGITLSAGVTGDDQTYENQWTTGSHQLTYHIGNVNVDYFVNITGTFAPVKLAGNSLSLDGDIGVNFFLNIPDATAKNAIVKIAMNGKVNEYIVNNQTPTEKGYKFTVRTAAKEMRDEMLLWVENTDGTRIPLLSAYGNKDYTETGYTYTVQKYFNLARNNTSDPEIAKIQDLIDAMETYGEYAQTYFKYKDYNNIKLKAVNDVTSEDLETYKIIRDKTAVIEGLEYGGSNLTLESVTAFSHFFKVTEGHRITDYSFISNGKELEAKWDEKNQMYRVSFNDIAAKELGDRRELIISDETASTNISYSALSYARTSVKNNYDSADLCRALYKYYIEAYKYFIENQNN